MVSAILMRLAGGDFRLQGLEVTTWTIRRGSERVEVLRVRVGGGVGRDAPADGFEMTIRMVFVDRPGMVAPVAPLAWCSVAAAVVFGKSEKSFLGLRENCALFVTIS